jgi:DNA helicase-4
MPPLMPVEITLTRPWWLRWLRAALVQVRVEERQTHLTLAGRTHTWVTEPGALTAASAWGAARILEAAGKTWAWVAAGEPERVVAAVRDMVTRRDRRDAVIAGVPAAQAALNDWESLLASDRWFARSDVRRWRRAHGDVEVFVASAIHEPPYDVLARALAAALAAPDAALAERNHRWRQARIDRDATLLDTIEAWPLTGAQREAIVCEEDRHRVVAAAGTGKTSTLVGKCVWLAEARGVPPGDILLLAYNRDAAMELARRTKERLGAAVTASTFHALGLRVLAQRGVKPDVTALDTDDEQRRAFIERVILDLASDPNGAVWTWFSRHLHPYVPMHAFESKAEYVRDHIAARRIRTLRGDQVRSQEECEIANWLLLHGVEYEYEAKYVHNTATRDHRQYHPDFYLPEQDIWIEHFGVDANGRPAPFIDAEAYAAGMAWKVETHERFGTKLIVTRSADRMAGRLFDVLQAELRRFGVPFAPVPFERIAELPQVQSTVTQLGDLAGAALTQVREGGFDLDPTRIGLAPGGDAHARATTFAAVVGAVRERWEAALGDGGGSTDFAGMIADATRALRGGEFVPPWSWILVDEFQDISGGRADLLQALLEANPAAKLLAVGDDWQAINRFAGGDVRKMTEFHACFGEGETTTLDRSFRFGDRQLAASSSFITENPGQLRKPGIRAGRVDNAPPITVLTESDSPREQLRERLDALAESLPSQVAGRTPTVLVLGRTHRALHQADPPTGAYKGLDVHASTVHKAKGLEADATIVLRVSAHPDGFPSMREDDPVLDLVMPPREAFANAEERRIFYVALTRSRLRTEVIASAGRRSPFATELLAMPLTEVERDDTVTAAGGRCPSCQGNTLVARKSHAGQRFWACAMFPYCDGTMTCCDDCRVGLMTRQGDAVICTNTACQSRRQICPHCSHGWLVLRTNTYSGKQFLGCSMYSNKAIRCKAQVDVPANASGGSR